MTHYSWLRYAIVAVIAAVAFDTGFVGTAFIDTQVSNVGLFRTENSCLPAFRWSA
jgi:hypothetical protein